MDMKKRNANYIYIYDEKDHQIIVIDSETGEKVNQEDDRVSSIIEYLKNEEEHTKLRKFAVWCSHQMNDQIKPIQKKLIELAERAIDGDASREELKELYEETEGEAVATDSVGLQQGSSQAPAFLTSRECINPDPYQGALQAARFHRLWAEMREKEQEEAEKEQKTAEALHKVNVSTDTSAIAEVTQKQVDYLLDLIGN